MQISDMLGQYQRNITNNSTEELQGVSGMQKLVSTVGELSVGNIFEGTVSSIRGGKVTLALSNGQMLMAQMDGKVNLQIGTPMFFQVKSNDGAMVAIRPYLGAGNAGNPILLNALTTAGIPVNARNLSMVDAMMREQMPIDKQSILNMARVLGMSPDASVQTAVEMTKLGIPVTNELAAQFENYRSDGAAVLNEMNQAMDQLTELLGSEEISSQNSVELNQKIIDVLLPERSFLQQETNQAGTDTPIPETGENHLVRQNVMQEMGGSSSLSQVLSEEERKNLTRLLQNTPAMSEHPELFKIEEEDIFVDTIQEETALQLEEEAGQKQPQILDSSITVEKFLKSIQQVLNEQSEFGFAGAKKLLGGREYQKLLKSVMEEKWLLRPDELKSEHKVSELYERLNRQINQLEELIKAADLKQTSFLQTAADVRNHIEFMNQINQIYTYVQLPLKMTGQNANADLYVYTNKKRLSDPDAEVTAFLHLDLEHLGSTDVSVRLQRRHVNTNFYFSDDGSYTLVQQHLPLLEEKLKAKGYSCTFSVINEEKKVDFVEDFLRKDYPAAGTLHRYSFDVRT